MRDAIANRIRRLLATPIEGYCMSDLEKLQLLRQRALIQEGRDRVELTRELLRAAPQADGHP